MDSIQAVREAIESLSTDEKIDEGQYLTLMNHLKSVYENLERSERKEDHPFVGVGNGISNVSANTRHLASMYLSHHFTDSIFINNFTTQEQWDIICELGEALVEGGSVVRTLSLEGRPSQFVVWVILRKGYSVWKDLDKRELLLSNPSVRTMWLSDTLNDKHRHLVGFKNTYRAGLMEEADWTTVFQCLYLPFYTSMKKKRNGDLEERKEEELKNLHPITITLNIPNHPIEIQLYTDKIQLGRTNVASSLCRLMLLIVKSECWYDVPLEKILNGIRKLYSERSPDYPKMKVSGITARTRAKSREYVCADGLIRLTYREKYAK